MSGVGQIDPSIAVNANRPQMDLLGTAGQAVGIKNALLQGQQQRQALQQGQIGIDQSKLNLALTHYQALGSLFTAALGVPPAGQKDPNTGQISQGLTDDYMHSIAQRGIAMGLLTPEQAAQELSVMPPDDAGKRQQIRELLFSVQDNAGRLQALAPPATLVNRGNQLTPMQFPAGAPPRQMGDNLSLGLSPEGAASRVPTIDNDPNSPNYGQPTTVPLGSVPGATGGNVTPPPSATGGTPPPASSRPAGTLPTGLPPGVGEARAAMAGVSVQQGAALQHAVDSIPSQRTQLENLSQLLNHFTSGPASDIIKRGKSYVNELTGANIFDTGDIAAQDAFVKQATQLAQTQFGQLGGTGTDAKLDSAMHTNPSSMLSNESNREIIAMLQGNLDALQAKGASWQAYMKAHGPQSYGDFQTDFNQHFDPRVFQMSHLPPKNRAAIISDMSATERADFLKNWKYAESQGWVHRSNLQSGQ